MLFLVCVFFVIISTQLSKCVMIFPHWNIVHNFSYYIHFNKHFLGGRLSPASSLAEAFSLESFFETAKCTFPLVMALHLFRH